MKPGPDSAIPAVTLANCKLGFECPQRWEQLKPTSASQRHCSQCNRNVHYCTTDQELAAHVRMGHCVAFQRNEPNSGETIQLVGDVLPPDFGQESSD